MRVGEDREESEEGVPLDVSLLLDVSYRGSFAVDDRSLDARCWSVDVEEGRGRGEEVVEGGEDGGGGRKVTSEDVDPVVPASVRFETEYVEIDVPECTVHLDFLLDPDLVRIDGPRQLSREESLSRDELRASGVEDASGEGLDKLGVGEAAEGEMSV